MPIRPPALDDRDFAALVDELLDRVSAHTPEWSPRLGDPGRTMVELFAWLADTLLYRANLIPERQRLAFLRLLGVGLRPAIPASGLVSISLDAKVTDSLSLQPYATIKGPINFETKSEITVLPVTAQAYTKRALTADEAAAYKDIEAALTQIYNTDSATPYITTAHFVQTESLDLVADAIDQCLWVALLAPQPELVVPIIETLGRTNADGQRPLLNIGAVPLIQVPDNFFGPNAVEIGPRARLPFTWEIGTGRLTAEGQPEYLPLDVIVDSTNGLTNSGVFRVSLPSTAFIGTLSNDVQIDPFAGTGDRPPRLDDLDTAARLITWIRLRPTPPPPEKLTRFELSWIGVNAVEIDQRQTVRDRILGSADGTPNPTYTLPGGSVDPTSLIIEVDEPDLGYRPWQQVEDLALAGRDDKVFQLDPEAGTLTFGDGLRGQLLPAGQRIRIAQMRTGGGLAGNLPAGSLTEISALTLQGSPAGKLAVHQPISTTGGEDAEDLAAAEQRIPALLRHQDRAVTETDYRQLAADTPGVRVGRVEVLPRFHPEHVPLSGSPDAPDIPGVVSVMVLPFKGTASAPNPRPDRPFLEAIHAYLSQRRPLGTELYVIGCQYRPIALSVGVDLLDGFNRDSVLLDIRNTLFDFLWPLIPGDVTGQGWRLGKGVRDRTLETIVARTPGVSSVDRVNLFEQIDNSWVKVENPSQPDSVEISLLPWELPELLAVVVTEGDTPDDLSTLPPSSSDDLGMGVPVVMEVC